MQARQAPIRNPGGKACGSSQNGWCRYSRSIVNGDLAMDRNRRSLLAFGGAGLAGAVVAGPPAEAARHRSVPSGGTAATLSEPQLLSAFAKARYSLDARLTCGWMDATTYAFIEGTTYPLYRLLAATWARVRRVDELHFVGRTLETAYFFDIATGAALSKLRMPVTGREVDVKPYRAGPSNLSIGVREETGGPFRMAAESRDGQSFFRQGTTRRLQSLSEPVRDGDTLYIREDLSTRVFGPDGGKPIFFYAEWTQTALPWKAALDPRVASVDGTVGYSAVAAFRPWMQMDGVDGHTLQNGRGGKVQGADALPPRLLEMVKLHDPDLLDDPTQVLGALP
jgi:hypothetical protein